MKVLFASDGSACSQRAADYLGKTLRTQVPDLQVTLYFVGEPMMARVQRALGKDEVARIRRKDADHFLRGIRQRLKRAGIAFEEASDQGDPAACISARAVDGGFDVVVMGSHGRGTLGKLLLGSVCSKVLAQCRVPVLVVP